MKQTDGVPAFSFELLDSSFFNTALSTAEAAKWKRFEILTVVIVCGVVCVWCVCGVCVGCVCGVCVCGVCVWCVSVVCVWCGVCVVCVCVVCVVCVCGLR